MMRFYYKADVQQKAKILRKVRPGRLSAGSCGCKPSDGAGQDGAELGRAIKACLHSPLLPLLPPAL